MGHGANAQDQGGGVQCGMHVVQTALALLGELGTLDVGAFRGETQRLLGLPDTAPALPPLPVAPAALPHVVWREGGGAEEEGEGESYEYERYDQVEVEGGE